MLGLYNRVSSLITIVLIVFQTICNSGAGVCICGRCECNVKYRGRTCFECLVSSYHSNLLYIYTSHSESLDDVTQRSFWEIAVILIEPGCTAHHSFTRPFYLIATVVNNGYRFWLFHGRVSNASLVPIHIFISWCTQNHFPGDLDMCHTMALFLLEHPTITSNVEWFSVV